MKDKVTEKLDLIEERLGTFTEAMQGLRSDLARLIDVLESIHRAKTSPNEPKS